MDKEQFIRAGHQVEEVEKDAHIVGHGDYQKSPDSNVQQFNELSLAA